MTQSLMGNVASLIRTRILGFTPIGGGGSFDTRIGGRLYIGQAPDNVTYPYGVIRLHTIKRDGAYNGDRLEFFAEVTMYGHPRSMEQTTEYLADIAQMALLRWADVSTGLVFSRGDQRDSLPVFTSPADRELVGVRLVFDVIAWPKYLTQYTVS